MNDLPCAACGGRRQIDGVICAGCNGRGVELVTSCPREMITPDIYRLLSAADDARHGFLPVAGGTLDQSQSLMDGIRQVWALEAPLRARSCNSED